MSKSTTEAGHYRLAPGDIVAGRYKLLETLGDGAMGQVFVAETLAIGRKVAVKVLKPELLADASFAQRFRHEAEAIGAIEHRNVARFLDLVVGAPTFIVMEYVPGPTLDHLLAKEQRLNPKRAAAITVRLCWALEAVHRAGVIHRDIKPSNVIVTPDMERGEEPKLIDFGLAKLARSALDAGLTRTGQIVGTPEYMAPEQISNKPVDPRSDVYALGCLLYELVTGKPPFEGADDVQVLYQQLHEAPKPVEVPDCPAALKQALERAMQKKPEDRYQSMREMAGALSAVDVTGEPPALEAAPPRPNPARTLWLLGVALGALAAGFGLAHLRMLSKAAAGGTAILFITQPPGATVELDGRPLAETTPTSARGLAVGTHTVKLRKGAMGVVERQVTLSADERAVLNVVLPPASHTVEVHTMPEGASVFLDGRLAVGETPTLIEVTDDDFHELRLEKPGFETVTRALTPDDKQTSLTVPLAPEKRPRGILMVDSNSAAEVWIDGVDSGYTTPTLGIHLSVGEHTVEVRDGAQRRAQARVTIERGHTVRLLLSPEKR